MKKIVILGGSQYSKKIYSILKDAGFSTVCLDRDPDSPCSEIADEFYPIDIIDSKTVCNIVSKVHADGIMAISDFGTRSASYTATRLNLIGLPMSTINKANDKGYMRDVWNKFELPQPKYRIFSTLNELRSVIGVIGYPCVVKPTESGGGGRGVSVLRSNADIEWSYNFALPYANNHRFIVEEYIEGIEMTIESFSNNGEVTILAMSDKIKPDLRTRVATSLHFQADFREEILEDVKCLVIKAVQTIGINIGMAHTEVIVTNEGPKLVEIAARPGGNHIFHTIIEAVSGFNAPIQFARLLTGLPVSISKLSNHGAVYRFFTPPYGLLTEVQNLDSAAKIDGVLDGSVLINNT